MPQHKRAHDLPPRARVFCVRPRYGPQLLYNRLPRSETLLSVGQRFNRSGISDSADLIPSTHLYTPQQLHAAEARQQRRFTERIHLRTSLDARASESRKLGMTNPEQKMKRPLVKSFRPMRFPNTSKYETKRMHSVYMHKLVHKSLADKRMLEKVI